MTQLHCDNLPAKRTARLSIPAILDSDRSSRIFVAVRRRRPEVIALPSVLIAILKGLTEQYETEIQLSFSR